MCYCSLTKQILPLAIICIGILLLTATEIQGRIRPLTIGEIIRFKRQVAPLIESKLNITDKDYLRGLSRKERCFFPSSLGLGGMSPTTEKVTIQSWAIDPRVEYDYDGTSSSSSPLVSDRPKVLALPPLGLHKFAM